MTNIAVAGGPCTGKSTLAASLLAALKVWGLDYDLVLSEPRKLQKEFGNYRSPFERFYMWERQEHAERRSTAEDGFITDQPLFHFYVEAKQYAREERDALAVTELLRMCLERKGRYQLIVLAEDPSEIPYKTDQSRSVDERFARQRHALVRTFVEHHLPGTLLLVKGEVQERTEQVLDRLTEMRAQGA